MNALMLNSLKNCTAILSALLLALPLSRCISDFPLGYRRLFPSALPPYNDGDTPKHLPAGLTQYVLNNYTTKDPPYHITSEGVSEHIQHLDIAKLMGHQLVRGRGGKITVMYETHWHGLLRLDWKRE